MAEYIEREALVRQIICNMAEFIGAPDDAQKHDEQCNYAISMIENTPAADVAPVVQCRSCEYSCTAGGLRFCTFGVCKERSVLDTFFCASGLYKTNTGGKRYDRGQN